MADAQRFLHKRQNLFYERNNEFIRRLVASDGKAVGRHEWVALEQVYRKSLTPLRQGTPGPGRYAQPTAMGRQARSDKRSCSSVRMLPAHRPAVQPPPGRLVRPRDSREGLGQSAFGAQPLSTARSCPNFTMARSRVAPPRKELADPGPDFLHGVSAFGAQVESTRPSHPNFTLSAGEKPKKPPEPGLPVGVPNVDVVKPSAPSFSIRERLPAPGEVAARDVTVGPAKYLLPSAMGPQFLSSMPNRYGNLVFRPQVGRWSVSRR